jgi:hypothetical protein
MKKEMKIQQKNNIINDSAISENETISEIIEVENNQEFEEIESLPEHVVEEIEVADVKTADVLTEITNKQKIRAILRAIENKKYSIDRENEKCRIWEIQGKDRDDKANFEYNKRKVELDELLRKNQERYDKRMAKTHKWWHQYIITHRATKIKSLVDGLALLEAELMKLDDQEPKEAI